MNKINSELHIQALELSENYRTCEAKLLDVLIKIDHQKIYLDLGYPSLFQYCVDALKLSEAQSYSFMTVARKSKEVPELKTEIEAGRLSLSKARKIVPILKPENQKEWIQKAKELPKAELEKQVADISPFAIKIKESVRPVSKDISRVSMHLSDETLKDLRRAQVLLISKRRKNLDLEGTLKELLEGFLKKNDPLRAEKKEAARTLREERNLVQHSKLDINSPARPVPGQVKVLKRAIPQAIRRKIFRRDHGQCSFKGSSGKICGESAFLEIHHLRPWSLGGNHAEDNLQVLCHAHHERRHMGVGSLSRDRLAL
ncbi:MAG: HNH endonuclease [Deltaproteobacteria bacterium]|nr:HNH endonuclease [Deltaproteobacteria bacterium]